LIPIRRLPFKIRCGDQFVYDLIECSDARPFNLPLRLKEHLPLTISLFRDDGLRVSPILFHPAQSSNLRARVRLLLPITGNLDRARTVYSSCARESFFAFASGFTLCSWPRNWTWEPSHLVTNSGNINRPSR